MAAAAPSAAACVGHHVALSLAGTDRAEGSGYLRARAAQEHLVKASRIPYTIVRSTRCFHPDRVVAVLADVAVSRPLNGSIGIDAPEGVGKVA